MTMIIDIVITIITDDIQIVLGELRDSILLI